MPDSDPAEFSAEDMGAAIRNAAAVRQILHRSDKMEALLKRCFAFVEYQVDHYKRDGDRAYVDLDLGEASILLVDLQEVTR